MSIDLDFVPDEYDEVLQVFGEEAAEIFREVRGKRRDKAKIQKKLATVAKSLTKANQLFLENEINTAQYEVALSSANRAIQNINDEVELLDAQIRRRVVNSAVDVAIAIVDAVTGYDGSKVFKKVTG